MINDNIHDICNDGYIVKSKYIILDIILIMLFIYLLLWILFNYKYDRYYITKGIVVLNDNTYYLRLYVNIEDISKIINNKLLTIDNINYSYTVKYIREELMVDNNYKNYKEILIPYTFNQSDSILNNVIDVKVKYNSVLLIKMIYYFILGKEI